MTPAQYQFHDRRQMALSRIEAAARDVTVVAKIASRDFAPVDFLADEASAAEAARQEAITRRQAEAYRSWKSPSDLIKAEVAEKHGVTVADIEGFSRRTYLNIPRQEAMYRLRVELKKSYPQIAKSIGGRDHTTAINGAMQHAKRNGLSVPPREFRSIVSIDAIITSMRQERRFTAVSLGHALLGDDACRDHAYAAGIRAMDRIRKRAGKIGASLRYDRAVAKFCFVTENDAFSRHAILPRNPAGGAQ